MRIESGQFPYDVDAVKAALESYLVAADPTGFVAGKGSAYDYAPSWMRVPKLYAGEHQDDPLVVLKWFSADGNRTWYITEYDGQDTAFGLIVGFETELGYVSLTEIKAARGPMGLRIERDLWFEPTPVTQLPEYKARWGDNGPYRGTPKQLTGAKANDLEASDVSA